MQEKNLNVSSLIVMCKPEDISRLWEEIEKIMHNAIIVIKMGKLLLLLKQKVLMRRFVY